MSFFEIFQPGARYQREERDRRNTLTSRPAAGAKGPLGIDLDSGKATFSMPDRLAEEDRPTTSVDDDTSSSQGCGA